MAFVIVLTNATVAHSQVSLDTKIEMFRKSAVNESTEPSYLVLTVFDETNNLKKEIATTNNLLIGAIRKEFSLNNNEEALEIILSNQTLEFAFKNQVALANLNLNLYSEVEFKVYAETLSIDSIKGMIGNNPAISQRLRLKNKDWLFDYSNKAGSFADRKTQVMFVHVLFINGIRTYKSDVGNIVFYHTVD